MFDSTLIMTTALRMLHFRTTGIHRRRQINTIQFNGTRHRFFRTRVRRFNSRLPVVLGLMTSRVMSTSGHQVHLVVATDRATLIALVIGAFTRRFSRVRLHRTVRHLRRATGALAPTFVSIRPRALKRARSPNRVILLFLTQVTHSRHISTTLPPYNPAMRVHRHRITTITRNQPTVTDNTITIRRGIRTIRNLSIIQRQRVPLRQTSLPIVSRRRFRP